MNNGVDATDARWLTDDEQAVWRSYLEFQSRLNAQLTRDLQDQCGLSIADFSVLVALSEAGERRLRVLELARALRWEKSRLSHQLTRMQLRGLITRANCNEDRRGAWVALTDNGMRTLEAAAPTHVESVRNYLFDVLTPGQVREFGDITRAVLAVLDPEPGCPDPCAG